MISPMTQPMIPTHDNLEDDPHQDIHQVSHQDSTPAAAILLLNTPISNLPKVNPPAARQTHHSRPHSVKSLYFVSVHPMQKQQKLDIRLPPDVYVKTHNYSLAGPNPAYLYPVLYTGLRPFRFSSLLCLCERPALAYSLELNHVGKDAALKQ